MSFSAEVKAELCRAPLNRRCCAQAEAYGVLLYCNTFSGGEVRIMATTFEWADDIDLERAQRAQKEALERLESLKLEDRDFSIAEAKLKRALARIHAKE